MWYLLFATAFIIPYFFQAAINRRPYFSKPGFIVLILVGPAIFALKISLAISFPFSQNNSLNLYYNYIVYWPILLALTIAALLVIWKIFDRDSPFYGFTRNNISFRPYFLLLLMMVPLICIASTQQNFLDAYPKLNAVTNLQSAEQLSWFQKLLFEISYSIDFINIELFFRGFLVLAFVKWAGTDAILPMACFYCTIHFGKPLGECISSYFGGMILGIIVYHTRSIYGGLLIHLGIAWLMEIGGYLGNQLQ